MFSITPQCRAFWHRYLALINRYKTEKTISNKALIMQVLFKQSGVNDVWQQHTRTLTSKGLVAFSVPMLLLTFVNCYSCANCDDLFSHFFLKCDSCLNRSAEFQNIYRKHFAPNNADALTNRGNKNREISDTWQWLSNCWDLPGNSDYF